MLIFAKSQKLYFKLNCPLRARSHTDVCYVMYVLHIYAVAGAKRTTPGEVASAEPCLRTDIKMI